MLVGSTNLSFVLAYIYHRSCWNWMNPRRLLPRVCAGTDKVDGEILDFVGSYALYSWVGFGLVTSERRSDAIVVNCYIRRESILRASNNIGSRALNSNEVFLCSSLEVTFWRVFQLPMYGENAFDRTCNSYSGVSRLCSEVVRLSLLSHLSPGQWVPVKRWWKRYMTVVTVFYFMSWIMITWQRFITHCTGKRAVEDRWSIHRQAIDGTSP